MVGYISPHDHAEGLDARSGRHLGHLPGRLTDLALTMHVIGADHDLAVAQPLLATRQELTAT